MDHARHAILSPSAAGSRGARPPDREATPAVVRSTVDGVPAFWMPAPGLTSAGIVFRTGQADEPLADAGITHLVEHLALRSMSSVAFEYQGTVDATTTHLYATGHDDEVAWFLQRAATMLADLDVSSLEREARVLEVEASARDAGAVGRALWMRYGARGFGVVGRHEWALAAPRPDRVRQWAATRFTKANAAVWWAGGTPPSLSLPLPSGPAPSTPPLVEVPWLTTPCVAGELPSGGIAVALIVERSMATVAAATILVERANRVLRHERGHSYGVTSDYQPLDRRVAHLTLIASCLDSDAGSVLSELVAIVDGLAASGPTADELERMKDRARRDEAIPKHGPGPVVTAAMDHVMGFQRESHEARMAEREALTPRDVARAVEDAMPSAIALLPDQIEWTHPDFTPRPQVGAHPIAGWSHARRDTPLVSLRRAGREELVVGPAGVGVRMGGRTLISVPTDEIEVAVDWPDGAVHVFGADATVMRIDPDLWRSFPLAKDRVRQLVPTERWVVWRPDG